jgi:uncharacterized delta-60 repeat protein
LNTDGSFDTNADSDAATSWGGATGIVNADTFLDACCDDAYIRSMALQSTGKVVAMGIVDLDSSASTDNGYGIVRYNSDGTLDTTFGTSGKVTVNPASAASDRPYAMFVLPDDSIVVAGSIAVGGFDAVGSVRLTANGQLDTLYGTGGIQINDLDAARADRALAAVMAQDGKTVLGGYHHNGTSEEFATVRLESTSLSDFTTWGAATNFGMCLRSMSGAGAAVSAWPLATGGDCGTGVAGDDADWHAVPTTTTKVLQTGTSGTTNVTANFRFGVKLPLTQASGSYMAPITFEVIAPNS